jgi:hypothetical protein
VQERAADYLGALVAAGRALHHVSREHRAERERAGGVVRLTPAQTRLVNMAAKVFNNAARLEQLMQSGIDDPQRARHLLNKIIGGAKELLDQVAAPDSGAPPATPTSGEPPPIAP